MEDSNNDILSKIMAKLGEFSGELHSMRVMLEQHKEISAETHKIVAGNGDPSKGLATKFELLEVKVSGILCKLDEHIEQHKDDDTKREERIWGLAKPLLEKLVIALFTGGGILGIQAILGG